MPEFVEKAFLDADFLDSNSTQGPEKMYTTLLVQSFIDLKDSSIVRLASNPGVMDVIPDSVLVTIINQKPKLVLQFSKKIVLMLAKSKPWMIGKFSTTTLLLFSRRQDVLMALSDRDFANLLAFQPGLLSVLTSLPEDVVVNFLDVHIDMLDIFPAAAIPFLRRILQNRDLVRAIPADLHIKLANKKIVREIIDKYTLLDILEAHPTIVARADMTLVEKYMKFLRNRWFRQRLPCEAVRYATNRLELLQTLSTPLLKEVITCPHILSCIERRDLEHLMLRADLGSRLRLSTLVMTVRNLRLSQLSLRVALNFVTQQVPQSNSYLFFN